MIINFIGIDGSGKTTQAKLLTERLKRHNVNCDYSWSKWDPFLLKPFIRFFRKTAQTRAKKKHESLTEETEYSAVKNIKKKLFNYKSIQAFYQYIALLDYYFQIRKKVIRPLKGGRTIICDRYFYDLCVDFAINFSYSEDEFRRLLTGGLFNFFPKPQLVFLIDVPASIGAQRKSDGTPQSYLEQARRFYNLLAKHIEAKAIDGTQDINTVADYIFSQVNL